MAEFDENGLPLPEEVVSDKEVSRFGKIFILVEDLISYRLVSLVILFVMLGTTIEVLARLIANHSFKGWADMVEIGVVFFTYTSLSLTQRDMAHIRMDLLPEKYSGRPAGNLMDIFGLIGTALTAAFITYATLRYTGYLFGAHSETLNIYLPCWIAALFIPLGASLLFVRATIQSKTRLTGIIKHDKK